MHCDKYQIIDQIIFHKAVATEVPYKTIHVKGFGRTEVNLLLLKRLHVPQLQVSVREAHCHLVGPGEVLHGCALGPTGPAELQTQVSALPAAGFPQPGDVCRRLGDHLQV